MPESQTIQRVLGCYTRRSFKPNLHKYFLIVIGDNMLRKHQPRSFDKQRV
jgi:ribosomal protein L28